MLLHITGEERGAEPSSEVRGRGRSPNMTGILRGTDVPVVYIFLFYAKKV